MALLPLCKFQPEKTVAKITNTKKRNRLHWVWTRSHFQYKKCVISLFNKIQLHLYRV